MLNIGVKVKFFIKCQILAVSAFALSLNAVAESKPETENPLIVMAAITGKPTKEATDAFLKSFREVGISQILMYPRSGLEIEYLSDVWFDYSTYFVERAKALGYTSFWLYDEYNWPSGRANGKVMEANRDFALKYIKAHAQPDGSVKVEIYTNPTKPDVMNREAIKYFIQTTHEKYKARLSKHFGNFIKGIFTDEPAVSHFGEKRKKGKFLLPYYRGIEADYKAAAGSELLDDIADAVRDKAQAFPKRDIFNRLIAQKFADSYSKQLSDWCGENKILLTGHLLSENINAAALDSNGHHLRVLSEFSLPAIDEIPTCATPDTIEWLTFSSAMYAIEKRGNGGLAEMFALGPVDMKLSKIRRHIWLVAMFGIDHYLLAISPIDMRGNVSKFGWLNLFTNAQPWFPYLKELGNDAKLAAQYAHKTRKADIAVRYPHYDVKLEKFLTKFAKRQMSFRLLQPDDKTDSFQFVANFDRADANAVIEEKSGKRFASQDDFLKFASENSKQSARVENIDGTLADEIFIREFDDSSAVVLNFGKAGNYVFRRGGEREQFRIECDGVKIFPSWKIKTNAKNTKRAVFEKGKFNFRISENMPLKFALRSYCKNGKIYLDGKELSAENSCNSLPNGMRELYGESDEIHMKTGEHTLEIRGQKIGNGDTWSDNTVLREDYPFLPNAIIVGDFSELRDRELSIYKGDGKGLYGYSGTISQSRSVDIPTNAIALSLDTDGIATEVFIDGKSIGRRAWAPFEWTIPREFVGRNAQLEIVRSPSLVKIFGAVKSSLGRLKWQSDTNPINPVCSIRWIEAN